MKHLFVPYEIALKLKELGFDETCLAIYHRNGDISFSKTIAHNEYYGQECMAPLYQQVVDWLRDTHQLQIVQYPQAHDMWEVWRIYCMGYERVVRIASINEAITEALKLLQ